MKTLQSKYNLLHIFYWAAFCSLTGFAAIFLTSKGLSNTLIGTATGGACLLSILSSPALASFASKHNTISLQKILFSGMAAAAGMYLIMALLPLPAMALLVLYMSAACIITTLIPYLSQIALDLASQGMNVSFGTARGLGSLFYGGSAVLLTQIANNFSTTWLSFVFAASTAIFCFVLMKTPAVYAAKAEDSKSSGMFSIARKYPVYFLILAGFCMVFAASTALATYLINIIHGHGGSDSLYGFALFCMAASELPFMFFSGRLIKRFGALPLMGAAAIFYIFRNVLIATGPNLPLMLTGMLFQGASYGLMTGVITVYASKIMKPADQVMGQTMITVMTNGVGSTIGNVAGGWLIDNLGMQAMFSSAITLTFWGSAIMLFAVGASLIPVLVSKMAKAFRPAH